MARQRDTFKEVEVYESPGWTIRVHRPELTDEERSRRMEEIKKAVADVVLSKRRTNNGQTNTEEPHAV